MSTEEVTNTNTNTNNNTANDTSSIISNDLLNNLGLGGERESNKLSLNLSEAEVESKFSTLALALKFDQALIAKRIELVRHQLDITTEDVFKELDTLGESIHHLVDTLIGENDNSNNNNMKDSNNNRGQVDPNRVFTQLLPRVQQSLQVLKRCVELFGAKSVMYGSATEENRLLAAFQVILLHVDNIRLQKEKACLNLKEVQRLLKTCNAAAKVSNNGVDNPDEDVFSMQAFQRSVTANKSGIEALKRSTSTGSTTAAELRASFARRGTIFTTPAACVLSASMTAATATPETLAAGTESKARRRSMPVAGAGTFVRLSSLTSQPRESRLEKTAEEKEGFETPSEPAADLEQSRLSEVGNEPQSPPPPLTTKESDMQQQHLLLLPESSVSSLEPVNHVIFNRESVSFDCSRQVDMDEESSIESSPTQESLNEIVPEELGRVRECNSQGKLVNLVIWLIERLSDQETRTALALVLLLISACILVSAFSDISFPFEWLTWKSGQVSKHVNHNNGTNK